MQELTGLTLGQYKIIEQVGQGGVASVYKAYQPGLERYVAIKVLSPLQAQKSDFKARFQREAKAIAALNHPNILPVYDFGQRDDYAYLVMRLIEPARTLQNVMISSLSLPQMSDFMGQIAAALDAAHQQGVIHRDVKPANVLLDGDWALLSDFGMAKLSENSDKLTGSGVGLGTPAYMSPEQGQGAPVDYRTDIYALGVILFEMLTRQIPHQADTPFGIIIKRLSEPLPSPRSLNPDISAPVETVLQKVLAAEPAERYDSAGAFATAFTKALAETSTPVDITPVGNVEAEPKRETYRIRLLGPLQVEKKGGPLPPFRTQKTSALLGYLLRQSQPVSRSYLAHLFWGEHTEARGRRNLSNELSHLSAQLPGFFETDRHSIQFAPSAEVWLDTATFEELVKSQPERLADEEDEDFVQTARQPAAAQLSIAQLKNLTQAVTLFQGDFMAGQVLNGCPDFEIWLLGQQEYWRQQVTESLDRLIGHHLHWGDEAQAQQYARQWLTIEPWREEAHRHLMLLLARNGQRSAALAQYELCRRMLAEELAVTPAPETETLYEQIRLGAIGTPGPGPAIPEHAPRSIPAPKASPTSLPPAQSLTSERRNQLILLDKVKNFWVKGVLDQTLQAISRLELSRQTAPQAVEQPWEQTFEPLTRDPEFIPPDKSMLDLFQETDRALLILGNPGAGKTISLIELARDLIALAEYDSQQPIPIILNLASWGKQRRLLAEWVVAELTLKYQIPRKMGAFWLEQNDLVILLDGFDEIETKHQMAALQAINHFRETNGLSGLVVCSRGETYVGLGIRLRLGGAIQLQPLSVQQIDDYLATAGSSLSFLRVALQREVEHEGQELLEVLESPLMLSVIRLAYEPSPPDDTKDSDPKRPRKRKRSRTETSLVLQANQDGATRRKNLFAAYVERMLERRGLGTASYSTSQTEQWLTWLAQKLFQHNQSVFLIEQIQPSWLPSRGQRWLYLLLTRAVEALTVGVLVWALLLFWQPRAPQIIDQAAGLVVDLLPFSGSTRLLLGALLIAQGLSLIVTLFDGLYYEWLDRQSGATLSPRIELIRHLMVAGLAGGIPFLTILAAAPGAWWVALYWGANGSGGYALISYLIHGQSFQDEIQAVEGLGWSWPGALKGALFSLIPGAVLQLVASQFNAAFVGIGLLWVLSFTLFGGLRGRTVETKTQPNQGINLSAKNGLIAALLGGAAFGLTMGLTVDVADGIRLGLAGLLIWGGFYGASNIAKHYILRLLLWRKGRLPWRYAHFLDYAAERIILRKVGGGYIFMHRLLQVYFANLAEAESSHGRKSQVDQAKEKPSSLPLG